MPWPRWTKRFSLMVGWMRRCRRFFRTYVSVVVVAGFLIFLFIKPFIVNNQTYFPKLPQHTNERNYNKYVTKFDHSTWRRASVKKILVWTPFFDKWDWVEGISGLLGSCPAACVVTRDRTHLDSSDAVLFHPNDMWYYRGLLGTLYNGLIEMPPHRQPGQVWVTFSMEPTVYMWGDLPGDTFNWTILYRRESTIFAPFSNGYRFNKQILEEQSQTTHSRRNYFKEKTQFASTLVGNCKDTAQRYRIIRELKKYIDLDYFGRCSGRYICSPGSSPAECGDKHLRKYKFYLAFENSFCRDYVSEKFWLALERRQIPVIATPQYTTEILPPRSYLNVFDFASIKDLAERMNEIGNSETLYNSYFDWVDSYKADLTSWQCKLCKALHANLTAQSYSDMEGWIRDDTCQKSSAMSIVTGFFDRLLFDTGLT